MLFPHSMTCIKISVKERLKKTKDLLFSELLKMIERAI